jgi:hypothetical protein
VRSAPAALLFAISGGASACGYCVEDKVASAYDHAVVARAMTHGHHVAFFHVDGTTVGENVRRALARLAESAAGIDPGSARVSADAMTLSVAYDPKRTSFAAVHAALEKRLSGLRVSLMPLQVMERPGGLRSLPATTAQSR